jgi:hypothetical protein
MSEENVDDVDEKLPFDARHPIEGMIYGLIQGTILGAAFVSWWFDHDREATWCFLWGVGLIVSRLLVHRREDRATALRDDIFAASERKTKLIEEMNDLIKEMRDLMLSQKTLTEDWKRVAVKQQATLDRHYRAFDKMTKVIDGVEIKDEVVSNPSDGPSPNGLPGAADTDEVPKDTHG